MENRKPLTDEAGEVRELQLDDFRQAKSFSSLPLSLQRKLTARKSSPAERKQVSVPLSEDVLKKIQSTGEGWELRIEEAVRQWLARQEKRRRAAS
uniref:BrnA antitoxin family protein n=1 Tax=Acidobacterium capsulatum TaxID=33075 RepID=A0A7V5CTN0_9BACT